MGKDVFGREKDYVECFFSGTVVRIPAKLFFSTIMDTEPAPRKFLRYKEGAELYSMSPNMFKEIARDAGAVYKRGTMALVNKKKFDEYLKYFYC